MFGLVETTASQMLCSLLTVTACRVILELGVRDAESLGLDRTVRSTDLTY